jgi:Ca-activated chloride channel family protein
MKSGPIETVASTRAILMLTPVEPEVWLSVLWWTLRKSSTTMERLAPTDRLSVVQFDERVQAVIPPQQVGDRAHLCRLLDGIRDGGSTNLLGGWLRGATCVREGAKQDFVNRVILLTDDRRITGSPILRSW